MRAPNTTSLLLGLVSLAAAAGAWFSLAPAALGGSTTHVVTDGVSMQPHFHAGDLALVRRETSYHVGEIVAYRSTLLHTVALHRIVGRDGGAYLLTGEDSDLIDRERALGSQLLGSLWLRIPGVGAWLQSLRASPVVGGLSGVGVLLICAGAFARGRRRRRQSPAVPSRPGAVDANGADGDEASLAEDTVLGDLDAVELGQIVARALAGAVAAEGADPADGPPALGAADRSAREDHAAREPARTAAAVISARPAEPQRGPSASGVAVADPESQCPWLAASAHPPPPPTAALEALRAAIDERIGRGAPASAAPLMAWPARQEPGFTHARDRSGAQTLTLASLCGLAAATALLSGRCGRQRRSR